MGEREYAGVRRRDGAMDCGACIFAGASLMGVVLIGALEEGARFRMGLELREFEEEEVSLRRRKPSFFCAACITSDNLPIAVRRLDVEVEARCVLVVNKEERGACDRSWKDSWKIAAYRAKWRPMSNSESFLRYCSRVGAKQDANMME